MRLPLALLSLLLALPLSAAERDVVPGRGTLAAAISVASPGDHLKLGDGVYSGPVTIDRALTVTGSRKSVVDGLGNGTVMTVAASDVRLDGFVVTGSGQVNQNLDAGVKILVGADRTRIENLLVTGNMHGIDVHGGRDSRVIDNEIIGGQIPRMNERCIGSYVWNSPATRL